MPQHKSAKKRVKTSLKSQTRNRALRSALRRNLRSLRERPASEKDQATRELQAILDRAVKHGIIHRNKAARLKSRYEPRG
jgi:small subunit ribosomal protein S20